MATKKKSGEQTLEPVEGAPIPTRTPREPLKSKTQELLELAVKQCYEFINQVDREGLGMKTITDHRKRVELFLKQVAKESLQ